MKKLILVMSFLSILFGCKSNNQEDQISENSTQRFSDNGEFVYNKQFAHFSANQVDSKGEVELEKFKSEFRSFDWKQQLTEANIKRTVSPSIAVRHNPTNYELGISVVGNDSTDYGFWIFFGKFQNMNSVEVFDEEEVLPYINKFFNKEFDSLNREI
ncbi:hypothetical protein [Salegentibacter mishustinae]|uniref:hypothetical protein n=1 Tax=Salegentibacter mishustinae TaxID=270918 RepID=UPI00248F9ACA|nr:hypothetical protein [Salegentibacter mishustinae]